MKTEMNPRVKNKEEDFRVEETDAISLARNIVNFVPIKLRKLIIKTPSCSNVLLLMKEKFAHAGKQAPVQNINVRWQLKSKEPGILLYYHLSPVPGKEIAVNKNGAL